jgi:hypothetical protein
LKNYQENTDLHLQREGEEFITESFVKGMLYERRD